jgi:DnaK suppressor protein
MPARKKKEPELLVGGIKPYQAKKTEKYMNQKQLDHFMAMLQGWKAELQGEIDRTIHQMQEEATTEADPNDRASLETDISLELRSRDREGKLVKKINEAIDRIEEGEYGYCETCGVEIGIQRLEARPTAELCIDCKTLDEIREKQMG